VHLSLLAGAYSTRNTLVTTRDAKKVIGNCYVSKKVLWPIVMAGAMPFHLCADV
jgi:hypothetical protein